jgi:transposase-like protein
MISKVITVTCPYSGSDKITKNGHNKTGKQGYKCNNSLCKHKTFVERYAYKGCDPVIRKQILKMAVNGNGTRATGRIWEISKDTVTAALKKRNSGHGK